MTSDLEQQYPSLFRGLGAWFRSRGVPADEAADLAQDTITRTFVHLKRHGKTAEDLGPLVRTIARNLFVERGRKMRASMVELSEAHEVRDPSPGPSELVASRETSQAVRDACASLSPRHRRVVDMWMSGMGPEDVARTLGIKRNAADALLHRAKRTLATRLRESGAALGAFISIPYFRARDVLRRALAFGSRLDPNASFASAASGLAAVGLAAVLVTAAPAGKAPEHAPVTSTQALSGQHVVTGLAPSTVHTSGHSSIRGSADPRRKEVVADVRQQHVLAQTGDSGSGGSGVEAWRNRGGNPSVAGSIIDKGTGMGCVAGVCSVVTAP